MKDTDKELDAMDKLRQVYTSTKRKLEQITGQMFNWSFW